MAMKVLIVDDSAPDRLIIKNILSEYSVLTACDGQEALEILDKNKDINLMILDINMPRMNGFEVLQAIKSDGRLTKMQTIILTSNDESENEIKGLQMGAVDYIRKPIYATSLQARVEVQAELQRIRGALEQKLQTQELTFDLIFDQAPIGIAISFGNEPSTSKKNPFFSINPMYEKITGRTRQELLELGWARITHPDDLDKDIDKYNQLQAGEIDGYTIEKRLIKPDGSVVWVQLILSALNIEQDYMNNHIALLQDITRRKEMESMLRYTSEHDRLTGLYNRYYLENLLDNKKAEPVHGKKALVGINLNSMQAITTAYGFNYTQEKLKEVAEMLKRYSTEKHPLFSTAEYRFVFYFLDYEDKNELMNFSNSIAKEILSLFEIERVVSGIGILEIKQDNFFDSNLLLKKLLIASEMAIKTVQSNYNVCFYDTKTEEQIMREENIRRELAQISVISNSSQLYLHFQPILDLKLNQISGFEALFRFESKQYGLISPVEFIPVAEKTKLIIPLGYNIIVQALRFLNLLGKSGFPGLSISINISTLQLLKKNFTNDLLLLLQDLHAQPEQIIIEITESALALNFNEINFILEKLQKEGIRIAIDDFGTGYSSLERERELNVNILKIDKSFIDNLIENADESITSDIISMAHKIGHSVVAEGVEQETKKQYLLANGCDKMQGYLISRPLDEAGALEFLKRNRQYLPGYKSILQGGTN